MQVGDRFTLALDLHLIYITLFNRVFVGDEPHSEKNNRRKNDVEGCCNGCRTWRDDRYLSIIVFVQTHMDVSGAITGPIGAGGSAIAKGAGGVAKCCIRMGAGAIGGGLNQT